MVATADPDAATLGIDCSVLYAQDGGTRVDFERAFLDTASPSSTNLVAESIDRGDAAHDTIGAVFRQAFYHDAREENPEGRSANGCGPCEICPDGASYAVDRGAPTEDPAFTQACDDLRQ